MTTVVPKLSNSDVAASRAAAQASALVKPDGSFARVLKDADAPTAASGFSADAGDASTQVSAPATESSAAAADADGSASHAGHGTTKVGEPESNAAPIAATPDELAASAVIIAGLVVPFVANPLAIASSAAEGVVFGDLAAVEAASAAGAVSKSLDLAQATARWAGGGLKDGSSQVFAPDGLGGPGLATERSAIDASASASVASTVQGTALPGVADHSQTATAVQAGGAAGSNSSPMLASVANEQGATALANALRNASATDARSPGFAASASGATSVATAIAAASAGRATQSAQLSDAVVLSATAGSITGTLSVSMTGGSAGTDLGGSTMGSQAGGAGSGSGSSSGGSRGGNPGGYSAQAGNLPEPNGLAAFPASSALAGAGVRGGPVPSDAAARSAYAATARAPAAGGSDPGSATATQTAAVSPPVSDAAATQDPRAAWRDLRSKWDQPIRANAPKAG
ncbi:MAG: hypothetical protein EBR45_09865 [Betaproteobacteria bacterium]|nr:hypothetical protein [Betaproteobacteria bacterium]